MVDWCSFNYTPRSPSFIYERTCIHIEDDVITHTFIDNERVWTGTEKMFHRLLTKWNREGDTISKTTKFKYRALGVDDV